jgi:hypothetical protein
MKVLGLPVSVLWLLAILGAPTAIAQTAPHIHLVFEGTGDPNDPCHTGDTTKESQTFDSEDSLLVCTLGDLEQGWTTDQTEGGYLKWTITPSREGDEPANQFVGDPPTETDGYGRAVAEIDASRTGNDFITVELCPDAGGECQSASVQRRVVCIDCGGWCGDSADNDGDGKVDYPQDPGCSSMQDTDETDPVCSGQCTESVTEVTINHPAERVLKGRVFGGTQRCVVRWVEVRRARRGHDEEMFYTRSGELGRWRVEGMFRPGRYYAFAQRKYVSETHVCLADRSPTIQVR